jgi:hypothetical protein
MITFKALCELVEGLASPHISADRSATQPRARWAAPIVAALTIGVALLAATTAGAAIPAPAWTLDSFASPTNFSEEENTRCVKNGSPEDNCPSYKLTAMNVGSLASDGSPITLTDTPPSGVKVHEVQFFTGQGNTAEGHAAEDCTGKGRPKPSEPVQCTFSGVLPPDEMLRMVVYVTVDEEATGPLTNKATVSGGGATAVSTEASNEVSSAAPPFGVSSFGFFKDSLNGHEETQAGAHPYELVTTINLNNEHREGDFLAAEYTSPEDVKDIVVNLPLGFVGSTLAAPECTLAQLSSENGCPPDTIVGHLFTEPENAATNVAGPIYNLVPERGYPAEFGYVDALHGAHVFYTHVVPTAEGYVLQTTAKEIPQIDLSRIVVTFYGDPALRDGTTNPQVPFFTNPTACSNGPQVATIYMDSWVHPARFDSSGIPVNLSEPAWAKATSESPAVTGCNAVQFTPELSVQPTTHQADTPSGLEFEARLAQSETVGTNATPALKNLTVTFPEGMTVDPSSADGLGVCSEAEIGWTGPTLFSFTPAKPQCPESSKIGSLELETPLIPGKIFGEVFLASQDENPFHSTFAIYVVVNDPITGVVLKIAGELKADPATGQLTSVFEQNPQLPFSDLKVHFFGGPRAELATPPACGTYTTHGELMPWSFPDSGPAGTPLDSFLIDEGCAIGFAPGFTGGATNLQAGAFTPFVGSISRGDSDEELGGLTMTLPPGLIGKIAGVPLCPDAQANAGTCPQASQVGTVQAGAGPGPNPLFVPGKIYLTGPYKGAPYGLSVVVPADPGPFHFGLVVVRQSLYIDPHTAQVTDVSDPFPTLLDPVGPNGQTTGIPIKLRRVDFNIDRPGFTFNPTSCAKLQVGGSISSTRGISAGLSTPFQVTNCAALKFTPTLAVTTAGKTSKANGASLTFRIAYPKGVLGTQSWFNEAKFELPKQLPARLTTIQKACLVATFEHNRGACPSASIIGHAVVHTEVLPVPLEGPVYFVSNGSAKFPDAVLVLDGSGVHIELHGETFINSKTGITSATFRNTPDVPFETLEVTVPSGPFSEFGANLPHEGRDFCGQKLIMPTFFKASNGAEIHQNTRIAVTGCSTKISVSSHRVHGKKITLTVYAPGAGRLKATGNAVSSATKTATGTETMTLTLKAKGHRHARHKLRVTFTPPHGRKQTLTLTLRA